MNRERPSQYDGTQFVIHADLPSGSWSASRLHEQAYGVLLDDGAKPWPYYRDAQTREWWSLSLPSAASVDALAWMIDLNQLAYKPWDEAEAFLETALRELAERADRLGGTIEPEFSISDALAEMVRVREMLRIRDHEAIILVAAPRGQSYRVEEWWNGLQAVGLEIGDGDLFWLYNEAYDEQGSEPYEWFCAEPYSLPGYFHQGDFAGSVAFPDVALRFRIRDVPDAESLLRRMAVTAQELAERLGAGLYDVDGRPFDLEVSSRSLTLALERLRELENG